MTASQLAGSRPLDRTPVPGYWLWLTVASSFFVYIEPAPCDLLGAALLLTAFATGQKVPRHLALPTLLLGLFLFGNLVGSVLSPEPAASLMPFAIRSYLVLGWWLLVASMIFDRPKETVSLVFKAYLAAAAVTAIAGTLAFFDLLPTMAQLVEQGRVRAFFKDPNVYGPFLVPAMIYCLLQLESSRGLVTCLHATLFAVLALGIVLGFSRGSWLNFTIAFCCYLLLRLKSPRPAQQKRRLAKLATAMLLLGCSTVIAAMASEPVRDMMQLRARVAQDYDIQSHAGGTKSRFDVQAETLALAMTRPLGIGAGQSEMDYNQGKAPHNLFLHTLVEGGWLGGLAFYAFVGLTLWQASQVLFVPHPLQGGYQVVFACILGLLAQSLFVDSTHWRHFYLLLAMLWGPLQTLRAGSRQGRQRRAGRVPRQRIKYATA